MQVRFRQSLGLLDIAAIKTATGVVLDPLACKEGLVCDVPQSVLDLFTGKKYAGLVEPVALKGEAKKPEITAPSK